MDSLASLIQSPLLPQGMAFLPHGKPKCNILLCKNEAFSFMGSSSIPFFQLGYGALHGFPRGKLISQSLNRNDSFSISSERFRRMSKKMTFIARSSGLSDRSGSEDDSSDQGKTPFGHTRKDVLLIGVGITVLGIGLKSGLEFVGVDSLQAGNVVQLVLVLGLTVGWIGTYIFRVSNKEMTYAQQLRDYEKQVMEKRLEGLTEAELEALLEQVEEEKRLANSEQNN